MLTKELIGLIAAESGLSKKVTEQLLDTTNAVLRESLMAGKTVQLQGIGSLEVKEKKERAITHPKTGKRTVIPRKNQLVFRPVDTLKEQLKNI